jgi:phosphatidylglycerol:prolipoprotein diacylglycerol transferase
MLHYPQIDPIIIELGPLAIRWYSLAYVAGIALGCLYADWLNKKPPVQKNLRVFDDFMTWVVLGIVFGGRIGYVLFYNLVHYLDNPLDIFKLWEGGMSFHGGFLGVVTACVIYCRKYKISLFPLFDLAACTAPIGLLFGRLANFINGELYGRITDSPLGMIFPRGGDLPRHPSQLYEAALEGIALLLITSCIVNFTNAKQKPGILSGVFVAGYGIARIIVENFREPDAQIGFLFGNITTGQALSFPMVLVGSGLVWWAAGRKLKFRAQDLQP